MRFRSAVAAGLGAAEPGASLGGETRAAAPLRALLVEDSEDDALLLVRSLKRGGLQVSYQRVDSAKAMRSALETGKWDIVISDHSMPNFSGTEALSLLRGMNSDIPFLFVSGTIGEAPDWAQVSVVNFVGTLGTFLPILAQLPSACRTVLSLAPQTI